MKIYRKYQLKLKFGNIYNKNHNKYRIYISKKRKHKYIKYIKYTSKKIKKKYTYSKTKESTFF